MPKLCARKSVLDLGWPSHQLERHRIHLYHKVELDSQVCLDSTVVIHTRTLQESWDDFLVEVQAWSQSQLASFVKGD